MGKRENSSLLRGRGRQKTMVALGGVMFGLIVVRLFTLEVVRHNEYARFAENNQLLRERAAPPRGYFRDRSGEILVDNVLHFQIVLPWHSREEVVDNTARLAAWLPIDTAKVMIRFDAWVKRNGRLAFPLVPDADKFMISFVSENTDLFPKLRVKSRARRRYRDGVLAAHVFGYVGEANSADVADESAQHYFPGDVVGKTALELYYESDLRGEAGQKVFEVNASGTILGEVKDLSAPPVPGGDLHLTLDAGLQRRVEQLVAAYPAAGVVVMGVDDGAILAATSLPSFDPNRFTTGLSQASVTALLNAESKPLFNRLTQARYPPGSTLKVISAYAVLVNDIVDPDDILVYCTGSYRYGNRVFRCWKPQGHGAMNLKSAVIQSCDVYFYRVAEMMDVDVLARAAEAFGFGTKTGIDLPGEVSGLVPDRAFYDRRYGRGKWTQGQMLNNIIGQGEYLANLLQVARMSAAVANGGYVVTPHFVERTGENAAISYPRRRVQELEGKTLLFLQTAMQGVTERGGTAYWARVPWLKTAGKTGTAQNPHGNDHAWYTAYAPADDPKVALAIIVENSGHGGEVAAPIAREIFSYLYPSPTPATPVPALPAKETVLQEVGD